MSENTTRSVRVRASELEGRAWLNTGDKNLTLQDLRGKIVIPSAASTACTSSTNYALSKKNSPTCSSPSAYTAPNSNTKQTP